MTCPCHDGGLGHGLGAPGIPHGLQVRAGRGPGCRHPLAAHERVSSEHAPSPKTMQCTAINPSSCLSQRRTSSRETRERLIACAPGLSQYNIDMPGPLGPGAAWICASASAGELRGTDCAVQTRAVCCGRGPLPSSQCRRYRPGRAATILWIHFEKKLQTPKLEQG